MPKKPKAYICISVRRSSKEIYPQVLDRINNDIKPAIDIYRKKGSGYWASIRMIAPVIEVISGGNKNRRNQILRDLGIRYPNNFWLMYRNGLIHNDSSPPSLEMTNKSIGWGLGWGKGNSAGMLNKSHYVINPGILLNNLQKWLKNRIDQQYDITIKETVLILINGKLNSSYKNEFEEMLKE